MSHMMLHFVTVAHYYASKRVVQRGEFYVSIHPSILSIATKQTMELIIRHLDSVGYLEQANFYVARRPWSLDFCIEWLIYRHCI
jgi:hypothetical protein